MRTLEDAPETVENEIDKMLDECKDLVSKRGKIHGPIDETCRTIASLWSVRTGVNVRPSDVCDMLEDLKWVRSKAQPDGRYHHDNSVDGINYKTFAYALRERGS